MKTANPLFLVLLSIALFFVCSNLFNPLPCQARAKSMLKVVNASLEELIDESASLIEEQAILDETTRDRVEDLSARILETQKFVQLMREQCGAITNLSTTTTGNDYLLEKGIATGSCFKWFNHKRYGDINGSMEELEILRKALLDYVDGSNSCTIVKIDHTGLFGYGREIRKENYSCEWDEARDSALNQIIHISERITKNKHLKNEIW